jgi:hypothetical protein
LVVKTGNAAVLFIGILLGAPTLGGAADLVDPMRPQHYQPPPEIQAEPDKQLIDTDSWRLTGVLLGAERRVAIINGQSLQLGAVLEGFRLVEVKADRAVLRNQEQRVVLTRAGTGLKK